MFRSIFLFALSASHAHAALTVTTFPPLTVVPVNDFSIVLTFSETVQKSSASVTMTVGDSPNAVVGYTLNNDDANKVSVGCSSPTAQWFNKVVLVPISRSGGLKAGKLMTAKIPTNCFKAYRSSSTIDYYMDGPAATSFTFTTESADKCSATVHPSPFLLTGLAAANIPYSPLNGAWLPSGSSTKFDLYFSESLQTGEGSVVVTETTGTSSATAIDTFVPSSSKVSFDGNSMKGRVQINKGTDWFKPGAKYALSIGKAAFKDKAGNILAAQFSSEYYVRVSTTIASWYPPHGCCSGATQYQLGGSYNPVGAPKVGTYGSWKTTNFTANHKLIIDFKHNVNSGTSGMVLCTTWSHTAECGGSKAIANSKMMFLGKKVIVNIGQDVAAGGVYNVSIGADAFLYFKGISQSAAGKWEYTFSVDAATVVDTAPPDFVNGFVDCSGDGTLSGSCNNDGLATNDFMELGGTLSADGNSPTSKDSKFKLYFMEKVMLKIGAKATLAADDGTAAVDITTTGTKIAVGTTTYDCVVTVNPTLLTGKKYTLNIGSGQITDAATLKNPYMCTSFTFYTPLAQPSSNQNFPTGSNIPKETLVKMTFSDTPRMGPTPPTVSTTAPYLTMNVKTTVASVVTESAFTTYSLTDTNSVKFQGKDILVIPQTPLLAGTSYTVKVPAHQLRYMTTDVSFDFVTRVEDVTKPKVMAYGPTITAMNKKVLDGTFGSPAPTTAYPKVPYVLFTEGVSKGSDQMITIYESAGGNMYNITASDATCTSGSPCVVMDTTYNSKVWLYPKGKTATANQATAWATAGRTYTVTLPASSFSDSITTGVNMNPLDKFSWTFGVSGDVTGPTLESMEHQAPKTTGAKAAITDGNIDAEHSSMFLTFNENVVAGDSSIVIKSYDYSKSAPVFSATGTTVINDINGAVTLTFDQKVQAGAGTVGLYKASGDAVLGTAVAVASAVYGGSKVFFQPSAVMVAGSSYYIKGSAAGAIKGAGGTAMAAAINTKSTASLQYVKAQTAVTNRAVSVVYNDLSEYACVPSSGILPDVTLYFTTAVTMGANPYVNRTGSATSWYGGTGWVLPGVSCDPDAATGNALLCSTLIKLTANKAKVGIGIGAQATSKKYKAVLYVSTQSSKTGTQLSFPSNSFATSAATSVYISGYNFTFAGPCATKFDTPASKLVRVYLPSGTFSQKFSGGKPIMGKQFQVVIPAIALKNDLGYIGAAAATYSWTHESTAPTLDGPSSSPSSGSAADEYESLVIAFNEVVQAGSGKFFLYDTSNTAQEAFAVAVTASGTEPGAKFFGKQVIITPKTSCFDTRRRTGVLNMTNMTLVYSCGGANQTACTYVNGSLKGGNGKARRLTDEEDSYDASWEGSEAAERRLAATTCRTLGDLEAGKTYYVTTVGAGVVKDVFGNQLAAGLNSKSSWSVSVNAASGSDTRAPSVVMATIPTVSASSTWGVGPTLTGYVYFSEKLKTRLGGSSITLQDCGTDMICGSGNDDVITTITSTELSYGDGTATDGTKEYGLLKYTKQVPTTNSKFKLTIPASAVEDFSGGSTNNGGPSAAYSFYFPLGDVAFPTGTDSSAPTVVLVTPTLATNLPKTTDLTLYFNEDVQKGSGVVSFCTNSDASATVVTSPCKVGAYANNMAATYSMDNSTAIDRRVLIMSLPNLKMGQVLYALMPTGLVKDVSQASNALAAGLLSQSSSPYSFSIIPEDNVAPTLQMIAPGITSGSATTVSAAQKINLYFSEAVQAGAGANVTTSVGVDITGSLSTTISGNLVQIGYTWAAGTKYVLNMGFDAFKDLAGNTVSSTTTATPPALALANQQFTATSDAAGPTGTFTTGTAVTGTLEVTKATTSSVFELNFNEIVQKGTGKISIYSGLTASGVTTTGTKMVEFDVMSLPLVSSVGASNIMMSSTNVQGGVSMKIGYAYRLIVPSTAYKDYYSNAFTGMTVNGAANTNYKKVNEMSDCQSPVFLTASMGDTASTGSNAAFPADSTASGSKIVMYFSENVQSATSGSVKLQPSTGGSFCSTTSSKSCATVGAACSAACGYSTAAYTAVPSVALSDVTLKSLTISGSKVTAALPAGLQAGRGYKLTIDRRAFIDVSGNSLTATTPGDTTAGMIYTLQVASVSTDSTGPLHLTTGTPAKLTSTFPTTGSVVMPPSTAIVISFDETIQAGTGSVSFSTTTLPVSSCQFSTKYMRCKPSANLATGTGFDVSFAKSAVKDIAGNSLRAGTVGATNSKLMFTTIDLDYMPPTLAAVAGVTYATGTAPMTVGGFKYPFDPVNGATKVAKGTLISMTFSETVQAGTGNVLFKAGTAAAATMTMTTYYSGASVYFQKTDLTAGTAYAVTTSAAGVFKDLNNQPLAQITSGFTFTTNPDDPTAPTLLQMIPENSVLVANNAPSTMITLYFSEAVQNVAGGTVAVGSATIPVDNSDLSKGKVSVVGATVTIDPFDDVGYGKTVSIKVGASTFRDLFSSSSNKFAGATYTFATPAFAFVASKTNNATIPFSQREGSILSVMPTFGAAPTPEDKGSYLLLYGGADASGCLSDSWTSTTGATWVSVTSSAPFPAKQAYAKTAVDEMGCLVLMGNSGSGCGATSTSGTIFKTCGVNTTTKQLVWSAIAGPPAVKGDAQWGYSSGISGHNIAIVGGWKLVVVDSKNGKVWNFLDKQMTLAQQVASSVPFAVRSDPILLTDSQNKLYLLGGYDGSKCAATNAYCAFVFTDVWLSTDFGATWLCQTANYDKSMTSTYTKTIGRYVGGVMTYDDAMFLIAGAKANATVSLSDIWTSYTPATETTKPIDYTSSMSPANGATGVLTKQSVTLYFDEAIMYKSDKYRTLNPRLLDGTNSSIKFQIATSISRQVMTMSLTGTQTFTAAHSIQIKIPAAALSDAAGNTLAADIAYAFTTNTDIVKPTFDSFTTTSNSSTGWDYRATSATMLVITTNEPVYSVGGVVNVTSTISGATKVSFDLSDSDVYNYKQGSSNKGMIFFTMPVGTNLTENTLYTISIPQGMVRDAAGNLNGAWNRFTFKTISGVKSYNDYANPLASASKIPVGAGMINDTAKPTFVSMWPPLGAGDVLAAVDTSVHLFFNEPVKFNATHPSLIQIMNNTGKVCGTINLTYEYAISNDPRVGHMFQLNGTKIKIGSFLKKDQNFTITVPAGVIVDMKNNPIDAVTKTFKTLALNADTVAPVVVNAAPYNGKTTVLTTESSFAVWFSENVIAGAGSITIKLGTTKSVMMAITDSNVTIAGPKMTFSYYAGALSSAGAWNLVLPPGLLKDAAGNQYRGLNASGGTPSQAFTVVAADSTKPTLAIANSLPAHEAIPTYLRTPTTAMQFTFSEAVQTGSAGSIILTPKYSSPTLSILSTSAEVAISGAVVVVSPTTDLMPGEVYGITIESGAFIDLQSNAYSGLTTGYTISTLTLIGWKLVKTGNFDGSTANYFGGERYGAAVTLTAKNEIFVSGGHNGTTGSAAMLNDVWKLATFREIHCAASKQPTFDCTTDGKIPGNTNAVTVCTGVTAGKSNYQRKIWRAPDAGGRKCSMVGGGAIPTVKAGSLASELGQIIEDSSTSCPCPSCTSAPPGLTTEYPTNNAIADLTFADSLPIIGNLATVNLTCATGYEPNASFVCGFDTLLSGKFLQPYPECQLAPCRVLPALGNSMVLNAECTATMTRFAHASTCSYNCSTGYGTTIDGKLRARDSKASDGVYTCSQGDWVLDKPGGCTIQTCDTGGMFSKYKCRANANMAFSDQAAEPTFGTECQVTCPDGQTVTQMCSVTAANPNGVPVMTATGSTACPATTTSPPPTTSTVKGAVTTPGVTTSGGAAKVYVTHSFGFSQDFADGATGDSLLLDTSLTGSVTSGLVDGLGAAIPELKGKIDSNSINLDKFTLSDNRRLTDSAARRLAVKKLTVDYAVLIPPGVTTDPSALGATLVSNKGAFESTLAASYAKAYEANTGSAPPGFTGVVASSTAGVKVVTVAPPTAAPTPAAAPTPGGGPSPSPTPAAVGGAPAPAPAAEEDDNTGMIVGIIVGVIVGVGLLGGAFYFYKKKKAAE